MLRSWLNSLTYNILPSTKHLGHRKERVDGPLSYVCYGRGYASHTDAVPATSSLTAHAEPACDEPVELSKHMSGARRPSRPMLSIVALETSPQQRPENVGAGRALPVFLVNNPPYLVESNPEHHHPLSLNPHAQPLDP